MTNLPPIPSWVPIPPPHLSWVEMGRRTFTIHVEDVEITASTGAVSANSVTTGRSASIATPHLLASPPRTSSH